MNLPEGVKFTRQHEWARDEGDGTVTVGITHHAQEALGDIVYVEVPEIGAEVEKEKEFAVVESVKAVSDVYSPVSGEVVEVNDALDDTPELVNESPYDEGWIARIRLSNPDELDPLMDDSEYDVFLSEED